MAESQFTVDTYFIITVLATILYMCCKKIWDNYFNKKRLNKHHQHLLKANDGITDIITKIEQTSKEIACIKELTQSVARSVGNSANVDSVSV